MLEEKRKMFAPQTMTANNEFRFISDNLNIELIEADRKLE
jgi:hypothetical protein